MKQIVLFLMLLIHLSLSANAQVDSLAIKADSLAVQTENEIDSVVMNLNAIVSHLEYSEAIDKPRYQLFPTTNMWTFLKLDTCTGLIWQVQYSTKGRDYRFEAYLNNRKLSYIDNYNGRYTLVATQNMYNFILLDQLTGAVYQVQWGMDEKDRLIIPIY